MATAQQIINKAREFLGVTENPKGSSNVVFNRDYYGYDPNNSNYHWCVVFVWDIFRLCGASALFYNGEKVNNCEKVQSWGTNAGLTVPVKDARAGDLVLYDWNNNQRADHIGICTGNSGSTVTTIEGNTDDKVAEVTRNHSSVCQLIRPKYSTAGSQTGAQYVTTEMLRAMLQSLIDQIK